MREGIQILLPETRPTAARIARARTCDPCGANSQRRSGADSGTGLCFLHEACVCELLRTGQAGCLSVSKGGRFETGGERIHSRRVRETSLM